MSKELSEPLQRGRLYPIARDDQLAREEASKQSGGRRIEHIGALWTGERRRPRKGEWYLAGSIIEAYNAPNDLDSGPAFAIAKLIDRQTLEPILVPLPDFPSCLVIQTARLGSAGVNHNQALRAYLQLGNGPLRDEERAIMAVAVGFDGWCHWHRQAAMSPYGSEQVTRHLYEAFRQALNHDTGRLDKATLSEWADRLMTACGLDTD